VLLSVIQRRCPLLWSHVVGNVWRNKYGPPVQWNFEGATEVEEPVPLPLCPPQISRAVAWKWTRASAPRSATNHQGHGTARYMRNTKERQLGSVWTSLVRSLPILAYFISHIATGAVDQSVNNIQNRPLYMQMKVVTDRLKWRTQLSYYMGQYTRQIGD
jgi:hypothetical protein